MTFHTSSKNVIYHPTIEQNLEALFHPSIRVVPEKDWSAIKAIWIPFLHHDYKNQLERSQEITILQPSIDKFGTIQGYLLARNENYIPYLTTFFNPTWTPTQVIENILQADENVIETQVAIAHTTQEQIIRKTIIGITKFNMLISITKDHTDKIINAFPIFNHQTPYTWTNVQE